MTQEVGVARTSHAAGMPILVGISASAGGLAALSSLLRSIDPLLPFAYVVLQHLSPQHRSVLSALLDRETALKVVTLEGVVTPRPGVVYVVPPTHQAAFHDGQLHLLLPTKASLSKPSINAFFSSLATHAEERSVGILLSGKGTDGIAGLKEIQAAGGVTLTQSPESAQHGEMAQAAISAGVVDAVLPPAQLARQLNKLAFLANAAQALPEEQVRRLLAMTQAKHQVDFTDYKPGTIRRRIRRRMLATRSHDLGSYLAYVEKKPQETQHLCQDMLISVTAFFRDGDAFKVLEEQLHTLVNARLDEGAEDLRVWVAGCATGEEAYSLAILFDELLRTTQQSLDVHIFATDIDDHALAIARQGVYSAVTLDKLPADLLERYFERVHDGYRVITAMRSKVIFARHNLGEDPPFMRLDLVTCRNVLIYFDTQRQAQVLRQFHAGLHRQGYLFLGRAETISPAAALFQAIDRHKRLYRRLEYVHSVADSHHRRPLIDPSVDQSRRHDWAERSPLLSSAVEVNKPGRQQPLASEASCADQTHQSLQEDVAKINQQLQSTNEALEAANEELQATNEELEAANEELQASNEALLNVNHHYAIQTQALTQLKEEFIGLYEAPTFPLLVFDLEYRLTRFNAVASQWLNLRRSMLSLDSAALPLPAALKSLDKRLKEVVTQGQQQSWEVVVAERHCLAKLIPSLNANSGEVMQVLLALRDISTEVRLQQRYAHLAQLFEHTVNSTQVMIAVKDLSGCYLFANRAFIKTANIADDYAGRDDFSLFPPALAEQIWRTDILTLRQLAPQTAWHTLPKGACYMTHRLLRDQRHTPCAFLLEGNPVKRHL